MEYVILPDVTCDLSGDVAEHFGLTDYVRGYVHIDNRQLKTTLDWENISRDEFYGALSNKRVTVSSAAASPEEYYEIFKSYYQRGIAVLSMSISSKISATYNIALGAAKRLVDEFPDAKIYSLDTCRMSGSFGLLVAYACELKREGKSFEEVIAWLEENKCRVHQMGPIDDLTFIARRGRISKGKAFFGNLAGVKPMGDSNTEGYVTVLAKAKGISKALDATVRYIERMATNVEDQYIFINHSDRERHAITLKEKLLERIKCRGIFISDVFSACGTNIGPGMISAYFLGEPISENNVAEKEALLLAMADVENK